MEINSLYFARSGNTSNKELCAVGAEFLNNCFTNWFSPETTINIGMYDEDKSWHSQEKNLFSKDAMIIYDDPSNNGYFGRGTYDALNHYLSCNRPCYRLYRRKSSEDLQLYAITPTMVSEVSNSTYHRFCIIAFGSNATKSFVERVVINKQDTSFTDKALAKIDELDEVCSFCGCCFHNV